MEEQLPRKKSIFYSILPMRRKMDPRAPVNARLSRKNTARKTMGDVTAIAGKEPKFYPPTKQYAAGPPSFDQLQQQHPQFGPNGEPLPPVATNSVYYESGPQHVYPHDQLQVPMHDPRASHQSYRPRASYRQKRPPSLIIQRRVSQRVSVAPLRDPRRKSNYAPAHPSRMSMAYGRPGMGGQDYQHPSGAMTSPRLRSQMALPTPSPLRKSVVWAEVAAHYGNGEGEGGAHLTEDVVGVQESEEVRFEEEGEYSESPITKWARQVQARQQQQLGRQSGGPVLAGRRVSSVYRRGRRRHQGRRHIRSGFNSVDSFSSIFSHFHDEEEEEKARPAIHKLDENGLPMDDDGWFDEDDEEEPARMRSIPSWIQDQQRRIVARDTRRGWEDEDVVYRRPAGRRDTMLSRVSVASSMRSRVRPATPLPAVPSDAEGEMITSAPVPSPPSEPAPAPEPAPSAPTNVVEDSAVPLKKPKSKKKKNKKKTDDQADPSQDGTSKSKLKKKSKKSKKPAPTELTEAEPPLSPLPKRASVYRASLYGPPTAALASSANLKPRASILIDPTLSPTTKDTKSKSAQHLEFQATLEDVLVQMADTSVPKRVSIVQREARPASKKKKGSKKKKASKGAKNEERTVAAPVGAAPGEQGVVSPTGIEVIVLDGVAGDNSSKAALALEKVLAEAWDFAQTMDGAEPDSENPSNRNSNVNAQRLSTADPRASILSIRSAQRASRLSMALDKHRVSPLRVVSLTHKMPDGNSVSIILSPGGEMASTQQDESGGEQGQVQGGTGKVDSAGPNQLLLGELLEQIVAAPGLEPAGPLRTEVQEDVISLEEEDEELTNPAQPAVASTNTGPQKYTKRDPRMSVLFDVEGVVEVGDLDVVREVPRDDSDPEWEDLAGRGEVGQTTKATKRGGQIDEYIIELEPVWNVDADEGEGEGDEDEEESEGVVEAGKEGENRSSPVPVVSVSKPDGEVVVPGDNASGYAISVTTSQISDESSRGSESQSPSQKEEAAATEGDGARKGRDKKSNFFGVMRSKSRSKSRTRLPWISSKKSEKSSGEGVEEDAATVASAASTSSVPNAAAAVEQGGEGEEVRRPPKSEKRGAKKQRKFMIKKKISVVLVPSEEAEADAEARFALGTLQEGDEETLPANGASAQQMEASTPVAATTPSLPPQAQPEPSEPTPVPPPRRSRYKKHGATIDREKRVHTQPGLDSATTITTTSSNPASAGNLSDDASSAISPVPTLISPKSDDYSPTPTSPMSQRSVTMASLEQ
ncbi:hypothetical protein HK102_001232, partial [Quaeritorhiza haematococci]